MTRDYNLVSPSTSACPKPGADQTPAFRPADPGDTAAQVARVSKPASIFKHGRSVPFTGHPLSRPCPSLSLSFHALSRSDASFNNSDLCANPKTFNSSFGPQISNQKFANQKSISTPIVPHFFALYRETKFFCKPQN